MTRIRFSGFEHMLVSAEDNSPLPGVMPQRRCVKRDVIRREVRLQAPLIRGRDFVAKVKIVLSIQRVTRRGALGRRLCGACLTVMRLVGECSRSFQWHRDETLQSIEGSAPRCRTLHRGSRLSKPPLVPTLGAQSSLARRCRVRSLFACEEVTRCQRILKPQPRERCEAQSSTRITTVCSFWTWTAPR